MRSKMWDNIFEHYKDEIGVCLKTCNGQTVPCTIPTTSTWTNDQES